MKDLTVQVPGILRKSIPHTIWRIPHKKAVFLTFDDGPIPEVTPYVLKTLQSFNVKATFFCVGDNVFKHPDIYQSVLEADMSVGNHTFHHLNAWKTNFKDYIQDIELAEKYIHSPLFRPPHGKLFPWQAKELSKKYQLIMWDVLSKDYDLRLSGNQCFENIKKYSREGSIIVFHDSLKSQKRLEYALPKSIEYLLEQGYNLSLPLNEVI